jgi:hypothetical protein
MSQPPVPKKQKIERDEEGSNGAEATSDREEQEEALVALIAHRTKEVEQLHNRFTYYQTQLEEAKKRLKDSETKLSRLRNPGGVISTKVERKLPIPSQNREDISQNQPQSKPQLTQDNVKLIKKSPSNGQRHEQRSTSTKPPLVIPDVAPKISQPIKATESGPKVSSGSGSRPSSSSSRPKSNTSHRAGPEKDTVENQAKGTKSASHRTVPEKNTDENQTKGTKSTSHRTVPEKNTDENQTKGTKRKFEQKEHKDLIRVIANSTTPRSIPCQTGSLISSQHKRKLRSLILCPTNDHLFVTSALDGIVNLWQVQSRGYISLTSSYNCSTCRRFHAAFPILA